MTTPKDSPGFCAQAACILEVVAEKAGNVHVGRDFADVTAEDFLLSAAAIAPAMQSAPRHALGETVLEAVRRTQAITSSNTNLGIVLLLAPLAAVFHASDVRHAVSRCLDESTVTDAEKVYEAIRLACPGGLGKVAEEDVGATPSRTLLEVMGIAADRDRVARQYAHGFEDVFETGLPALEQALGDGLSTRNAVVRCHLEFMAEFPDSLIQRKCGAEVARQASARARAVIETGWPTTMAARHAFATLDDWLRADDHRRNPGTSADLTVASLFLAFRDGMI